MEAITVSAGKRSQDGYRLCWEKQVTSEKEEHGPINNPPTSGRPWCPVFPPLVLDVCISLGLFEKDHG